MGTVLTLVGPVMNTSQSSYAMTESRLKKLLRLYLAWPLRFSADPSEEAVLFHGWLKTHYAELSVVQTLNSDDVSVFLSVNPDVIEAATLLINLRVPEMEILRRILTASDRLLLHQKS